jgi:hypothetical protein
VVFVDLAVLRIGGERKERRAGEKCELFHELILS